MADQRSRMSAGCAFIAGWWRAGFSGHGGRYYPGRECDLIDHCAWQDRAEQAVTAGITESAERLLIICDKGGRCARPSFSDFFVPKRDMFCFAVDSRHFSLRMLKYQHIEETMTWGEDNGRRRTQETQMLFYRPTAGKTGNE